MFDRIITSIVGTVGVEALHRRLDELGEVGSFQDLGPLDEHRDEQAELIAHPMVPSCRRELLRLDPAEPACHPRITHAAQLIDRSPQ